MPLSETATGLASSTDTTEYGVPRTGTTPKHSWLGTTERSTELPSGVIAIGARSYVPQIGRFLQTDPVPGGSANAYTYTMGDPVNSADPSGEYTSEVTYGELSDVSTGPGVALPSGHDIVPGALMPPPVSMQIEEAFNADPPWPSAAELLKQEEESIEAAEAQAMEGTFDSLCSQLLAAQNGGLPAVPTATEVTAAATKAAAAAVADHTTVTGTARLAPEAVLGTRVERLQVLRAPLL